jgi:hypothetical protein
MSQEEISSTEFLEWKVKAKNLLNKACGKDSEHYQAFYSNESQGFGTNLSALERLKAVVCAAREDCEGGYLRSARSRFKQKSLTPNLSKRRLYWMQDTKLLQRLSRALS